MFKPQNLFGEVGKWTYEDEQDWQSLLSSEPAHGRFSPRGNLATKDELMKAPAPTNQATAPRADDSTRLQFFNVDRLAGQEQTIVLKAAEFTPTKYGDVTFTLTMNGRDYLWDRKLSSNAYGVIIKAYGDETDNWIGKSLLARPYFNPKFKQSEVQIEVPKAKVGKK